MHENTGLRNTLPLSWRCAMFKIFPTLPSSEDSCEDMSSGEESLSSSPPSDLEGTFFFELKTKTKWQTLNSQSSH